MFRVDRSTCLRVVSVVCVLLASLFITVLTTLSVKESVSPLFVKAMLISVIAFLVKGAVLFKLSRSEKAR